MKSSLTQQQKNQMINLITDNEVLYDKILNQILDREILLSKYDNDQLGWGYTFQQLKNYFNGNLNRLSKYLNNQIYPKHKEEIDKLIFQQNKKYELSKILSLKDLNEIVQLIQKYDVKDQELLKQIYNIHKSNDNLILLQKIVDRIEDKKIKEIFEHSKQYQPTLFAKKKFINIAKQLYNDMNKSYAIAKDVYAVANYMSVVNES